MEKQEYLLLLKSVSVLALIFSVLVLTGGRNEGIAQWTMGGRNIAMGQTHTALPSDSWAVFHNPALMNHNKRYLGLFGIRYFGLAELEDHAAVLSFPLKTYLFSEKASTAIAGGVHSYGFELYRETQFRIGWSSRYERFRIGGAVNYVHLRIAGFGSRGSPVLDGGLAALVSEHVQFGFRITNLLHTDSGSAENDLYPAEMSLGVSWNGIPGLVLALDMVKDVLYPLSTRAGFEAELVSGMFLRGGWTTRPFTWSAGAGLHISRYQVSTAVQKHEILGLSPGIEMGFSF